MALKVCTRIGCGKEFDQNDNQLSNCYFHPGQPVFHEGLKSWSCCKDSNKPVMEFDQFMNIRGCTTGTHSTEKPQPQKLTNHQGQMKVSENSNGLKRSIGKDGKEFYSSQSNPNKALENVSHHQTTSDVFKPIIKSEEEEQKHQQKKVQVDPEDDESSIVKAGSKCRRLGCNAEWVPNDSNSIRGKLNREECSYHPGTAIFHEGSKGYSCCKRRVLEFDEFLKIKGCKKSSHLFLEKKKNKEKQKKSNNQDDEQEEEVEEEEVNCRFDYYQTPTTVIVSVFGKNANKINSSVRFESSSFEIELKLPDNKRFFKKFELFGNIDPHQSSYKILTTKCEIVLFKSDGKSWSNLERGETFTGTVTFGVSGRTGTIGAKNIVT